MGALGPFKGVLKLAFVGNGHPQLGISCLDLPLAYRVPLGKKKRQLSHQDPTSFIPTQCRRAEFEKRQRKI